MRIRGAQWQQQRSGNVNICSRTRAAVALRKYECHTSLSPWMPRRLHCYPHALQGPSLAPPPTRRRPLSVSPAGVQDQRARRVRVLVCSAPSGSPRSIRYTRLVHDSHSQLLPLLRDDHRVCHFAARWRLSDGSLSHPHRDCGCDRQQTRVAGAAAGALGLRCRLINRRFAQATQLLAWAKRCVQIKMQMATRQFFDRGD